MILRALPTQWGWCTSRSLKVSHPPVVGPSIPPELRQLHNSDKVASKFANSLFPGKTASIANPRYPIPAGICFQSVTCLIDALVVVTARVVGMPRAPSGHTLIGLRCAIPGVAVCGLAIGIPCAGGAQAAWGRAFARMPVSVAILR